MSRWTQDEYQKLLKVISSGADEVEFRDRKVKYRNYDKLIALRDEMERDLGIAKKRKKIFYSFTTNKGL